MWVSLTPDIGTLAWAPLNCSGGSPASRTTRAHSPALGRTRDYSDWETCNKPRTRNPRAGWTPGIPRGDMGRNRTCDLPICDGMLYHCATMIKPCLDGRLTCNHGHILQICVYKSGRYFLVRWLHCEDTRGTNYRLIHTYVAFLFVHQVGIDLCEGHVGANYSKALRLVGVSLISESSPSIGKGGD